MVYRVHVSNNTNTSYFEYSMNNNAYTVLFSDNTFLQITELANELYTTRTHYEEDLAEKDSITSQQNSEIISLKEGLVSTDLIIK